MTTGDHAGSYYILHGLLERSKRTLRTLDMIGTADGRSDITPTSSLEKFASLQKLRLPAPIILRPKRDPEEYPELLPLPPSVRNLGLVILAGEDDMDTELAISRYIRSPDLHPMLEEITIFWEPTQIYWSWEDLPSFRTIDCACRKSGIRFKRTVVED